MKNSFEQTPDPNPQGKGFFTRREWLGLGLAAGALGTAVILERGCSHRIENGMDWQKGYEGILKDIYLENREVMADVVIDRNGNTKWENYLKGRERGIDSPDDYVEKIKQKRETSEKARVNIHTHPLTLFSNQESFEPVKKEIDRLGMQGIIELGLMLPPSVFEEHFSTGDLSMSLSLESKLENVTDFYYAVMDPAGIWIVDIDKSNIFISGLLKAHSDYSSLYEDIRKHKRHPGSGLYLQYWQDKRVWSPQSDFTDTLRKKGYDENTIQRVSDFQSNLGQVEERYKREIKELQKVNSGFNKQMDRYALDRLTGKSELTPPQVKPLLEVAKTLGFKITFIKHRDLQKTGLSGFLKK